MEQIVNSKCFQYIFIFKACGVFIYIQSVYSYLFNYPVENRFICAKQRFQEMHVLTIQRYMGNRCFHAQKNLFLCRCCHGRSYVVLLLWRAHLKEKHSAALIHKDSLTNGSPQYLPEPTTTRQQMVMVQITENC